MSIRERYEDITALLYLVPFVGAVGYAIVLWAQSGASFLLPTSVYLTVTRDPVLFMVASLSILLGIMVEVNGTEPAGRQAKLASLGRTMQSIAIASLAMVLLSAWYANGFIDLAGAGTDFIVGRDGLVFPAVMVLLSYLLSVSFRLRSLADRKALAAIAMLLVPVTLYEVGKRQIVAGLATSLVLLLAGLFLFLSAGKKVASEKEG